jgi:hypothetical protein
MVHVDIVRPPPYGLRNRYQAPYVAEPVFGNMMVNTSTCVYAAVQITIAGKGLPPSLTHCFRGRTPELIPSP